MKGLELSRLYYERFGRKMLTESFPELWPFLAIGLCGSGSECFGYDDDLSQDHDFEPGFCIFLPGENIVSRRDAFLLERAYAKLPHELEGFKRQLLDPTGGARHGVIRTADFFTDKTGVPDGRLNNLQWLRLSDYMLAEATSGEIFDVPYGEFSGIRKMLTEEPEDVRRKKLAGHVLLMAQSGQYNYDRCLRHGETGAAQLAVHQFVQSAMQAIFLLNHAYMPYYKWSFRALRGLKLLSLDAELFEYLLTTGNEADMTESKQEVIESIADDIINTLIDQHLTEARCNELEKHAYSIEDSITDPQLRNMHILAAV